MLPASLIAAVTLKSSAYSVKIKGITPVSALVRLSSKKTVSIKKSTVGKLSIFYEGQEHVFKGTFSLLPKHSKNQHGTYEVASSSQSSWQAFLGLIRKNQHIEICKGPVEASDGVGAGFDDFTLEPSGLFQLDPQDCNLSTSFLGHTFAYPLMITGMTGGVSQGALINQRLARLASQHGIPMGVGSQRLAIEEPKYEGIFKLKHIYPDLFLIGNLGFAQLAEASDPLSLCQKAVGMIEADALAIHFNGIQEMIQSEGNRSFKGALKALESVCKGLKVPVLVKEVGCGFSASDVSALISCGVHGVDIGGKGGTSWGYIEGLRSDDLVIKRLGETFRNWGYPTAHSLHAIRQSHPDLPLSATGGIRSPIHVAKALALGAQMVGIGLPFFRAALLSEKHLDEEWDFFIKGLRIAMMATASSSVQNLRRCVRKNHL